MKSFSDDLSFWDYFHVLLLRPILALVFTFSVLLFGWLLAWKLVLVHVPLVQEIFGLRKKPVQLKPPGWLLAWKLVLVHVPLVQEIFGLRKKPVQPKPAGRQRFTQFYNKII